MNSFDDRVNAERAAQDAQWGGPVFDNTRVPEQFIDFIGHQTSKFWRDFGYLHAIKDSRPCSDRDLQIAIHARLRERFAKMAALAKAGDELIDRISGVKSASSELESMTRMFGAACADLGAVNEALGLDPDDGGAEPILAAIAELKGSPGVDLRAQIQSIISCMERGDWDDKCVEAQTTGDPLVDHLTTCITELHCELDDAMNGPTRCNGINCTSTDGTNHSPDCVAQHDAVTSGCAVPPAGWACSREAGHDGPCAALPISITPELPAWFSAFLTNVCEIPDRNSPEGEPDAAVATLDELRSCALNAIESTVNPKFLFIAMDDDRQAHPQYLADEAAVRDAVQASLFMTDLALCTEHADEVAAVTRHLIADGEYRFEGDAPLFLYRLPQ